MEDMTDTGVPRAPEETVSPPVAVAKAVEAHQLIYSYPGSDEPTVRGVSFEVGKGEIFGFLGPSGAGKSTTQRILVGTLKGFEGTARVLGRDLRDVGPEYYEHIGVGFELPNHYSKLTALENLRFFASFYSRGTREPRELLALVGLLEHAGKRVEDFSKGMKMRLNFVRAIMHDPEVLFLDEPTSGLDPVNARVIKDIIIDQRRLGKTIFLTTHNMHDAEELCDRVAFIVDGRIKLIDAPMRLRTGERLRRVLVEYTVDGELMSQEFPLDGLGRNGAFLDLLRDHEVISLHSQEPTLEDLFIQATGRRLS